MPSLGLVDCVLRIDDQVILAGSNTAGMYKTINGGQSWYSVTDDALVPGLGISDIVVDPNNNQILYATTGCASNGYGGFSLGVMKSTDQGETWYSVSELIDGYSHLSMLYRSPYLNHDLKIDPFNSNRLIMGGIKKLYVSNDAGFTWEVKKNWNANLETQGYIHNAGELWVVGDIEFDPNNEGVVYASTIDYDWNIASYNNSYVLKSNDSGVTWQVVQDGDGDLGCHGNVQIDFSLASPGVLHSVYNKVTPTYLQTWYASSSNGGSSWDGQLLYQEELDDPSSSLGYFHEWKGEFEMSEISSSLFYFGGREFTICRLFNGQWQRSEQNNFFHDDVRDLRVKKISADEEIIICGNDGGVSVTTVNANNLAVSGGITWQSINGVGLHLTQIYSGGSWNGMKNGIYGAQDNGSWRFDENSFNLTLNGDGGYSRTSPFFKGVGIVGSQNKKKYTYDFGNELNTLTVPVENSSSMLKYKLDYAWRDSRILIWAQNNRLRFYTVFESTLEHDNLNIHYFDDIFSISAFAIAPSDDEIIYVAMTDPYWNQATSPAVTGNPDLYNNGEYINKVFKSIDGGVTFTDITNNFKLGENNYLYQWNYINALEVDPRDENHVFAGFRNYTDNAAPHVVESFDGGVTWQEMSAGLEHYGVHEILYQDGSNEVLYAATDAGVFRWDRTANEWKCFNNNLPPCIATALDLDYCTEKLTVYTYGKGMWEVSIPHDDNDVVFSEDHIIGPFEQHVYPNDVIVQSGTTLTVQGILQFHEHARLIVELGAKLIVDGGLLTSACDELWQGVEVRGTTSMSQSPTTNQGHVVLKNGAIVENAHTGIWVQRNDEDCTLVAGTGGGIVHATNSTIQNCYIGVEFAPYTWQSTSNVSYFKNTTFQFTQPINQGFVLKSHAVLNKVAGIKFHGCRFTNDLADDPAYTYLFSATKALGKGIDSYSSSFTVMPYCDAIPLVGQPCQGNLTISEFRGLNIGVYHTSSTGHTFRVHQADFEGNVTGIMSTGSAAGSAVTENTFNVHPIAVGYNLVGDLVPFSGTLFYEDSGFELEGNTFIGDHNLGNGNPNQILVGAAFFETGQHENSAYRNTFDGFDVAAHAQGVNGSTVSGGEPDGLQFLCNDFGQNGADNLMDVALPSVSYVSSTQGSGLTAAGNRFSHLDGCMPNEVESDIRIDLSNEFTMQYYYTGGTDPLDETNPQKPICFTEERVTDLHLPSSDDNCESGLSHMASESALATEKSTQYSILQDVVGIYHGHVDKGDVKGLENYINNPNHSSIEVRNEMISCIPYLSDNAIKTAFLRTPAMDPWHLAQVLLMASPLKQSVINMMTVYNLDEFYRELVLNGQNGGITNMMILEADMGHLGLRVENARQDYLRLKTLSEEDEIDVASIISFLATDQNDDAKFISAQFSLSIDDYTAVQNYLNACDPNDTRAQVLAIELAADMAGNDCPRYTTQQLSALQGLAADPAKEGYGMALAILKDLADEDIEVEFRFPVGLRSRKEQALPTTIQVLNFYPNPANDVVYITAHVPDGAERVMMEVINAQGQPIANLNALSSRGLVEFNTKHLASGVYLCNLYYDEIKVATEKFTVVH